MDKGAIAIAFVDLNGGRGGTAAGDDIGLAVAIDIDERSGVIQIPHIIVLCFKRAVAVVEPKWPHVAVAIHVKIAASIPVDIRHPQTGGAARPTAERQWYRDEGAVPVAVEYLHREIGGEPRWVIGITGRQVRDIEVAIRVKVCRDDIAPRVRKLRDGDAGGEASPGLTCEELLHMRRVGRGYGGGEDIGTAVFVKIAYSDISALRQQG